MLWRQEQVASALGLCGPARFKMVSAGCRTRHCNRRPRARRSLRPNMVARLRMNTRFVMRLLLNGATSARLAAEDHANEGDFCDRLHSYDDSSFGLLQRHQIHHSEICLSGEPLRLAFFWSLNPDCTVRGVVTVRTLRAPEHGQLTIEPGAGILDFDRAMSGIRATDSKRKAWLSPTSRSPVTQAPTQRRSNSSIPTAAMDKGNMPSP